MTIKNGIKMPQSEKFKLIDAEVHSFYEYCKEAGISDEEMELICRPLTNAVRKTWLKKLTRIFLSIVMIFAIGYTVSQTESFQWHAAAAGRIFLIKILPFWDWTTLYYNKCLIDRPQQPNIEKSIELSTRCISCEAVKSVAQISATNYNEVFNHHLLRGAPVIVTDAQDHWPLSNTALNLSSFINDDDRLRDSVPCRILTNIRIGTQSMDLEEIVSRITNNNIPNWFVHLQNCDIRAVKSFRVLAPRPYFLSPHIPPSHFNWLLLSKDYDTHRFKYLELDIGLVIMSQLKGANYIQLKPRSPCQDDCFTLNFELKASETLVLGNSLWELEYLPSKDGENVAIISETDWVDF